MSKTFRNDLTGQRFGRLTVLGFVPTDDERTWWRCRCDCGNVNVVRRDKLISGKIKSCGCLLKEKEEQHGKSKTRLYNIYKHMKARCYNPNVHHYSRYGGRGITICDEWRNSFQAFYDWAMANGYSDDLSIDRIDVNGNYEPSNCKWLNNKAQNRNKRNNVLVAYDGRQVCIAEAVELSGIKRETLVSRFRKGDRGERLFRPLEK